MVRKTSLLRCQTAQLRQLMFLAMLIPPASDRSERRNTSSRLARRITTESNWNLVRSSPIRSSQQREYINNRSAVRSKSRPLALAKASTSRTGLIDLYDLRPDPFLDELARAALHHDLALVHDDQAIAQLLRLVHVVGGQDDGHPLPFQLADALPDEVTGLWVQTSGRFVQYQDARFVDQRPGDDEAALHPPR